MIEKPIDKIQSLPKIYSGKVRDLYKIDKNTILMVATDRISTFDIILNQLIPNKGIYLTQISLFWFNYFKNIKNHLIGKKIDTLLKGDELAYANGRSVIVKQLTPIPIEFIIRGYLAGNGFKDYLKSGEISGIKLPKNLSVGEKLEQAIFTPSTKAPVGTHDENITILQCKNIIGSELTNKIMKLTLEIYEKANNFANEHNVIIADSKFEFGLDENGELLLMDEILTPDSSRFWDKNKYKAGTNPENFDKQFIRDYLEIELKWDKNPPIPDLPKKIIEKTQEKYQEIIKRFNIK
ncbi:MAG TPA: phosphoribosylaminoimidazolesuccinocarboxamide synthase [Burkholderiales bacterium]|nr:phosphoribosylaminoimidazolesuccinocarboxamide synthase [Burkholderiales bacterium]